MSQATLTHRPYVNSNLFSSHYLDERLQTRSEWNCDDEAKHALEALQGLYELEGPLLSGYNEDTLIDNWIDEVLEIFGYGTQLKESLPDARGFVDVLLFETPSVRRDAAAIYNISEDTTELFQRGMCIVEAKQWDAAFNVRFSEERPYRDASHQIKHYLENTPSDIQWGILTNGRKWRLYGTKDYETQTYYEVDLPELVENGDIEAFKYFYVFFRPAAFRETGGTTFLDEVWSESETASQELGESLQDNVFTALRVLGRGFVETNDDLEIAPDDEEALNELKEQSLVFLYRLMFILYAEARGLIHPESQSAQDEYDQNFSFNKLRLDIHETIGEVGEGFGDEFSGYSTTIWNQLQDLFRLIDQGEKNLGIPPYNGGLFDQDEHEFLTEHEVSNQYLSEVIYRLSTTQNDEGRYVLADYADLDTRHLGSVYEGLLEHKFHIAPEQYIAVAEEGGQVWKPASEDSVADAVEVVDEGGLYVVNDEGERKSTGAYYTPDYVVTYIVDETVGPLVEEIRHDLIQQGFEPGTKEYIGPFFRRITDLRILDPAMGSGHFLTKATGYISEQVMAEVREVEEEFMWSFDEQHIRREIAKECIYGVDINGMAVELAKLSMWLETLAADRPLAFLDHHFKNGNSLIGSDITSFDELDSNANGDEEQFSLADFGATREGTIERLMKIYEEFLTIENETVEDIQEMKRKYAEIEQDELRQRLISVMNVDAAKNMGIDISPMGDRNPFEWMTSSLENDDEWRKLEHEDWFKSAQKAAEEELFFHWKLEFPEVFHRESDDKKPDEGFDAIIGNPPYGYRKIHSNRQKQYYKTAFETHQYNFEFYMYFTERAIDLGKVGGYNSFIIPNTYLSAENFAKFRKHILQRTAISDILYLGRGVFEEATLVSVIQKLKIGKGGDKIRIAFNSGESRVSIQEDYEITQSQFENSDNNVFNIHVSPERKEIIKKIEKNSVKLGEISYTTVGINTGYIRDVLVSDERLDERYHKMVSGKNIGRYKLNWDGKWICYDPKIIEEYGSKARTLPPERIFTESKILLQRTTGGLGRRLIGTLDEDQYYNLNRVSNVVLETDECQIEFLIAILNSTLIDRYFSWVFDEYEVKPSHLRQLPIVDSHNLDSAEISKYDIEDREINDIQSYLGSLAKTMIKLNKTRNEINLSLIDYLGAYSEVTGITDIGEYQPPKGVGDSKLKATKEDYENLRIGTVRCERQNRSTVTIYASARYKPDDEDAYVTDRWGYTETEPMPAMRLTDLTKTEADLVEAFVPVAVDEANGFAGFRETATKRNSLVDRLEAITLPNPDDVADDLERYREAVKRAEELDEKIQRTDNLIDEIVYKLYGLTDEEIEIIETRSRR